MRAVVLVILALSLVPLGAAAQTPAERDPAQAQEPIVRTIVRDTLGLRPSSQAQGGQRQLQQCFNECCCVAAGVRSCDQRNDCQARGGRCIIAPDGC